MTDDLELFLWWGCSIMAVLFILAICDGIFNGADYASGKRGKSRNEGSILPNNDEN